MAVTVLAGVLTLLTAMRLVSSAPGHSGDTVEFQFLAEVYGVAHPPGAAIYVPLVFAWRHLLPWMETALAVNLFSTACALVAVLGLLRLLAAWRVSTIGMLATTTVLLSSPLWMRLASVAELYVPAAACGVWALERSQRWSAAGRTRDLVVGALLLGLGAGIHPSVPLYGIACLVVALDRPPRRDAMRPWLTSLACFCAGLLACAVVLVVAAASPHTAFVWMPVHDLQSVWVLVSAKAFSGAYGAFDLRELTTERLPHWLRAVSEPAPWLAPLALLGGLSRAGARRFLAALALAGTNAVHVVPYAVPDAWDFVLPAQIAFALAVGLGTDAVFAVLHRRRRATSLAIVTLGLVALSPMLLLAPRWSAASRITQDRTYADRAVGVLETTGPRARIMTPDWQMRCTLWYFVFTDRDRYGTVNVAFQPDPAAFLEHLDPEASRPNEPTAPDVFVLGEEVVAPALSAGWYVYDLGDGLHLLRSRPDPTVRETWSSRRVVEHAPGSLQLRYGSGWWVAEIWGRWMLDARANVELRNVPRDAVLVLETCLWDAAQDPIAVDVRLDGRLVDQFVVASPPWRMTPYRVRLANPLPLPQAIVELEVDHLHARRGDRPRALPVASLSLETGGGPR